MSLGTFVSTFKLRVKTSQPNPASAGQVTSKHFCPGHSEMKGAGGGGHDIKTPLISVTIVTGENPGALTEVHSVLGSAPSLRDPPFASKVLIGGKQADEVGPQGAEGPPQLQDGQGLLAKDRCCHQSSPPPAATSTRAGERGQSRRLPSSGRLLEDSYLVQVNAEAAQAVDQEEGLEAEHRLV